MRTARQAGTGMSLCAIALLMLALVLPGCKLGEQKKTSRSTSTSVNVSTTTTSTNTAVSTSKTILVAWSPNRETAVNMTGGGYKVYYSKNDNTFPVLTTVIVTVPYVSGSLAPTTAEIANLTSGTYYVKIVAYSARNTAGSVASSISSLVVP